eukprot:TRINITY_DN10975_c0_g1_i1.p1 TRINITY_DN10975_c0_g1~~TRINITY_DN10975_c0_g1_i1.p1  ORF type:complete len:209 (-),score=10.26 TRINITY_DN10975_c0_g1_i1:70-696(-)
MMLHKHSGSVWTFAVWNDKLVSGSEDETIQFWDSNCFCVDTIADVNAAVLSLVPHGDVLYCATPRFIKIWNSSHECIALIETVDCSCIAYQKGWIHWGEAGGSVKTIKAWPELNAVMTHQISNFFKESKLRRLSCLHSESLLVAVSDDNHVYTLLNHEGSLVQIGHYEFDKGDETNTSAKSVLFCPLLREDLRNCIIVMSKESITIRQ